MAIASAISGVRTSAFPSADGCGALACILVVHLANQSISHSLQFLKPSMLLRITYRFGAQLDELPRGGLIVVFQEGIFRLIDSPSCLLMKLFPLRNLRFRSVSCSCCSASPICVLTTVYFVSVFTAFPVNFHIEKDYDCCLLEMQIMRVNRCYVLM